MYSCPMKCEGAKTYPEVRACPVCGMTLGKVSAAGKRYRVALETDSAPVPKDPFQMKLTIQSVDNGVTVRELELVHGKPIHLIVVSQDLSWFSHEHPEPASDGAYTQRLTLPSAGNFLGFAEFQPKGGELQTVSLALRAEGKVPVARPLREGPRKGIVSGHTVRLLQPTGNVPVGVSTRLRVDLSRAGKPFEPEPWLEARAHAVAISEDTLRFIHAHPARGAGDTDHAHGGQGAHGGSPAIPGRIELDMVFPQAGLYKLWIQFQAKGKVITAPFVVRAK